MKYLPKSILGAVMSALYLLLVFGILLVGYLSSDHRGLATDMYFIFWLLTLPMSILPILFAWVTHSFLQLPLSSIYFYSIFIMPFVGAFFNAAIIYLLGWGVGWGVRSLIKHL